jgi:monofunctional biosynthetic peptidoglycan transglycosylase
LQVKCLLDFDTPDEAGLFAPVDDAVMGGVSRSAFAPGDEGIAVFSGVVSLANNGGFASIRSRPRDWGIGAASAFVLRVRGDGKRYRFNVRTADSLEAFRYEAPVEPPPAEWTEVEIPVASMVGKAFGRRVPLTGAPDPSRVRTLGFMISDRQAGPFRLEVDWIGWR